MASSLDTSSRDAETVVQGENPGDVDDTGKKDAGPAEEECVPFSLAGKRRCHSPFVRYLGLSSLPPLHVVIPRSIPMFGSLALNHYLPNNVGSVSSVLLLMFTTSSPTPRNFTCRMMLGIQTSYTMATVLFGSVQNHGKAVAIGYFLGYIGVFCGDLINITIIRNTNTR